MWCCHESMTLSFRMNTWIFGQSGTGKTTYLITRLRQSSSFLLIDPHADDTLLLQFPKRDKVLVIDPTAYPVGWNILDERGNKPLLASLIRDTVKAVWGYDKTATPVLDRMLFNSVYALLHQPNSTLLDLGKMLTDADFRSRVLNRVDDQYLQEKWTFWESRRDYNDLISSTENKAGEFTEDPRIRKVVGRPSAFSLKKIMFNQGAIVLRLPQSKLGESKVKLLGSLFIAHLMIVASARTVKMPFEIYIEDCQMFDTPVLRNLLANAKRYGLSLTVTNQYLGQLSPDLRSSLLGNCSERVMFRTGIEDSDFLHRTIPEDNNVARLHERANYHPLIYRGGRLTEEHTKPLGKPKRKRMKGILRESEKRFG